MNDIAKQERTADRGRVRSSYEFETEAAPMVEPPAEPPSAGGGVVANGVAQLLPVDRLEQVLDASSDLIVCLDRQWCFTFLNRTARTLLQVNDLLGASMWTRFPGNLEEPFASHYRKTMEQRVATQFEAYAPAVGQWVHVRAEPIEGGLAIFSTDITALKQAEALRDASRSKLEQVFDATTDAIVSLDREYNYTFVNRQAALLLGRNDLPGKNLWQEFPSTGADLHLRKTMEDRIPCEFETYNPAPLDRWFRVQARPSDDGIVVFFRDVTEERAAKHILLDQQATLAFVQQTARVATWELDLRSEAMSFGAGSFPVFGRPCEEVTTLHAFREIVHPDDLPSIRAGMTACVASGEVCVVDYRVRMPDGSIRWLEGRGRTVYDGQGVPVRWRGMTTDITKRKENEERLRASEERYRVLGDLSPQALWVGAPDGSIVYANQSYLEYLGMTADDVGDTNWLLAFDPEDRERVRAAWTHSVQTGDEYAIEARLIRACDGASRWWSLRGLPVRDADGAIQQWLGVSNEIHESKTAAEALRLKQQETEKHRAELEAIYETAPIGLALFDPVDFRWLRLNESQAQIFGMHKEELIDTPLFDLVKIDGVRDLFERVASGTPVLDQLVEGELPNTPGEKRMWRVNYTPVFAVDGSVQAITSSTLEITREKRAEAALIQSEKLAAVGRLASSISHEINNPLEAITNLLYILGTDPELPASSQEFVRIAQSELRRVSQIVTQTLRFHRQAVNRTRVTAAELVNSVLNLYQGRLTNSGIVVESSYASETPIFCYENDIRQVLNNLIANAIDAMRGGGRLVVRAHDSSAGEGAVRITIADTGHGMAAKTMARIFDPFYTTKDLNGTGLGLWISAGIVEHHAGKLQVRSCQGGAGQGTVFTLTLPV